MLIVLAAWAPLAALYLLLVGQLTADEIGLALVCGLAATIWLGKIASVVELRLRLEPAAVGALVRAIAGLPGAVVRAAVALARGSGGEVLRQQFAFGRVEDPRDAGRRAMALLTVSLAPDKFALRAIEQRQQIELHSLVGVSAETDPRWPT
jgi:hypothetical protein